MTIISLRNQGDGSKVLLGPTIGPGRKHWDRRDNNFAHLVVSLCRQGWLVPGGLHSWPQRQSATYWGPLDCLPRATCFPVTGWRSFSFSPLILRLVASRLRFWLRGPKGLPCCRYVGLFVASRLSIRLCGPKGLLCCRLRLRGPEGLPCCRFRRVGLSFRSWPISLRCYLAQLPSSDSGFVAPGGSQVGFVTVNCRFALRLECHSR